MKGLKNKVVALVAVTTMAMASLMGCAGANVNNNAVVATVGDSELKAGVANFYMRYQQAMYESYFSALAGESMWTMEISEGVTYETSIKETVVSELAQMYILEDHMGEYNVTISDDEMAAIEKVADAFDAANDADAKEKVSAQREHIVELLRLITITNKMEDAMTADVDTEVSDDEAAQKKLQYVKFETTVTTDGQTVDMTEDEIAALKQDAEDFLTEAKANGDLEAFAKENDMTPSAVTFDADSTNLPEEVIAAADVLGEGEFSGVIETESQGFYVVQLTDLLDEEATETEKEAIVADRKTARFNELCMEWAEATEIDVDGDALNKISFTRLKVTQKVEETAE